MAGQRSVIPLEFLKASTRVLLACREHPVLYFTYSALESLAWGADSRTVKFDGDWFFKNFGIPPSTLLRHLNLLSKQPILTVLAYRSAGAGYRRFEITLMEAEPLDAGCLIFETGIKNENHSCSLNNKESSINQNDIKDKNRLIFETVSETRQNDAPERPYIFRLYEENIGPLVPLLADKLRTAEKDYPEAWLKAAFDVAVARGKRRWDYVDGVLKNWKRDGFNPAGDVASAETDKAAVSNKNAALIQRMVESG